MPFSERLKNYLKKGSFPLKSTSEWPLWNELITALEKNITEATKEVKALQLGYSYEVIFNTCVIYDRDFAVGRSDEANFMGALHGELAGREFNEHNRADSEAHKLVLRVRDIFEANSILEESHVVLFPAHADHGMGTGLSTPGALNLLPDPSICEKFGSQPDQMKIESSAPLWGVLKLRMYEPKDGPRDIGRKPHYVLAHLLNHQVNGSGKDAKNVVPFWATANTQMAKDVEGYLKDLVNFGVQVKYDIALGDSVGWTQGRLEAYESCETEDQRRVIEAEASLPAFMTISLSAQLGDEWVPIVSGHRLENYVPETVPVLSGPVPESKSPPERKAKPKPKAKGEPAERGRKRVFEPDPDDMVIQGREDGGSPRKKARTEPEQKSDA